MKKSSVEVAIRVRPMRQELNESKVSWEISNTTMTEKANTDCSFTFDRIYPTDSNTVDIYKNSVRDSIVKSVAQGYNGTVFAYGQTGSGKSFTMLGSGTDSTRGIVYMAVNDLFAALEKESAKGMRVRVQVTMLEIYNEQLRDLLCADDAARLPLSIRENEHGVYVHNALRKTVTNVAQCMHAIHDEAETRRVSAATSMNERSSRSHCLIRLIVEKTLDVRDSDEESEGSSEGEGSEETTKVSSMKKKIVSSLNLVDLAGSERVAKTGATGLRMVEGGHINKSLTILTTVINRLTDSAKTAMKHIPYRDSKLTHLLKTALGGNSFTTVFCCVTPAEQHTDETRSTLHFASRAKTIRNEVMLNEVADNKTKLRELELQVKKLRRMLLACDIYMFSKDIRIKKLQEQGPTNHQAQIEQLEGLVQQLTAQNEEMQRRAEEQPASGGANYVDPTLGLADDPEKQELRSQKESLARIVEELTQEKKVNGENLAELEGLCDELEKENDEKEAHLTEEKQKAKALETRVLLLTQQVQSMESQVAQLHEQRKAGEQMFLQRARGDELLESLTKLHLEHQSLQFEHNTLLDMFSQTEIEKAAEIQQLKDRVQELLGELDQQRSSNLMQNSFLWRLIAIAPLTKGKPMDPAEATGQVKEHQVEQAIKTITAFVQSRSSRPPGLTPSTVVGEGGEEMLVSVQGLGQQGSKSGPSPGEEALRKRVQELEMLIQTKNTQRDIIIDTKLKRMQELVLRLHTTNVTLRAELAAAVSENGSLHEFIRQDAKALKSVKKAGGHEPLVESDLVNRAVFAPMPTAPYGHN